MKDKRTRIRSSTAEFLIFTSQAGGQSIEARYEDETLWLSQKLMAELFGVDVRTISEHLRNIFASHELAEGAVIRKFRITASDGKNYQTQFYNLDAIISVGYRVNSIRATQFRQWATGVLREFAIKGYLLDRQRMENGSFLGECAGRQDPENRCPSLGVLLTFQAYRTGTPYGSSDCWRDDDPPQAAAAASRCRHTASSAVKGGRTKHQGPAATYSRAAMPQPGANAISTGAMRARRVRA